MHIPPLMLTARLSIESPTAINRMEIKFMTHVIYDANIARIREIQADFGGIK